MYLDLIQKFMKTAGQEVPSSFKHLDYNSGVLRLKLIFEELHELAVAMGQDEVFHTMCKETITKPVSTETPNAVEILDAYCDLEYVVGGGVLAHGLGDIYDRAFLSVHINNMSKFCLTEEEAEETAKLYEEKGIKTFIKQVNEYWVVYRLEDRKVLKARNYTPVNLKRFIRD